IEAAGNATATLSGGVYIFANGIPTIRVGIYDGVVIGIRIPPKTEDVPWRLSHRIRTDEPPDDRIVVPLLHVHQPRIRVVHVARVARPLVGRAALLRAVRPVGVTRQYVTLRVLRHQDIALHVGHHQG